MSRHFEDETEERTQVFTNFLIFRIHLFGKNVFSARKVKMLVKVFHALLFLTVSYLCGKMNY